MRERQAAKTSEWKLLKHQFDALVNAESMDTDSIEKIMDDQVRRRFAELINPGWDRQNTEPGRPAGSRAFHKGISKRF